MAFVGGGRENTILATDFQLIQDFLQRSCGLVINDSKQYLVKSRLSPLLPRFNLSSFSELALKLKTVDITSYDLKDAVIDAMTTNETYWFRDESQFNELHQLIAGPFRNNAFSIDIWSAACSSGQEPYSISMCLDDVLNQKRAQITATDISSSMLAQAQEGIYCDLAMARGLSEEHKRKFFQKAAGGHQVNPAIKQRIRFKYLNLMDSFSSLGQFDIIFCRNVLIYFADPDKQNILGRMVDSLKIGGVLFLSSTESMPASISSLKLVNGTYANYFQKVI